MKIPTSKTAAANPTAASAGAAPSKPAAPKDAGGTTAADPKANQRTFASQAELDAAIIKELVIPSALMEVLSGKVASKAGAKLAHEAFLKAAGNPTDPVEQIMLDQVWLANYRVADLHIRASASDNAEAMKIFTNAAARLLGELRRTALALRQYRLPPGQKSFTVVGQQNIATGGGAQEVKYVDHGQTKETLRARDELNNVKQKEDLHELRERLAKEPQPRRAAQPAAKLVDA